MKRDVKQLLLSGGKREGITDPFFMNSKLNVREFIHL